MKKLILIQFNTQMSRFSPTESMGCEYHYMALAYLQLLEESSPLL